HGPRQYEHAPAGCRLRRLRVRQRLLRRRPAVLGAGEKDRRRACAASHRAVHARLQRHAVCLATGLFARRRVLPVPARCVRRTLCRRRGTSRHDERRHALPAARAAGPLARPAEIPRSRRASRARVGRAPARHCTPLAPRVPVRSCDRLHLAVTAMHLNLEMLNVAKQADFTRLVEGTYENSPWIAERAWAKRPFRTLAALKLALVDVVRNAG